MGLVLRCGYSSSLGLRILINEVEQIILKKKKKTQNSRSLHEQFSRRHFVRGHKSPLRITPGITTRLFSCPVSSPDTLLKPESILLIRKQQNYKNI